MGIYTPVCQKKVLLNFGNNFPNSVHNSSLFERGWNFQQKLYKNFHHALIMLALCCYTTLWNAPLLITALSTISSMPYQTTSRRFFSSSTTETRKKIIVGAKRFTFLKWSSWQPVVYLYKNCYAAPPVSNIAEWLWHFLECGFSENFTMSSCLLCSSV